MDNHYPAGLQAITTRYDGHLFRSRLEARWAVFFATLGIYYAYEPEGFVVGPREGYLPDFQITLPWFLPEDRGLVLSHHEPVYMDVKPLDKPLSNEERDKLAAFIRLCPSGLVILRGDPLDKNASHYLKTGESYTRIALEWIYTSQVGAGVVAIGAETPKGYQRWLPGNMTFSADPNIMAAGMKAREARF